MRIRSWEVSKGKPGYLISHGGVYAFPYVRKWYLRALLSPYAIWIGYRAIRKFEKEL